MPLIPLVLRLPQLLLRLLPLVLPFPPFAPSPASPSALGRPGALGKHPPNRPRPARRHLPFAVDAHLAPARPLDAGPMSDPPAGNLSPAPDTPSATPPPLASYLPAGPPGTRSGASIHTRRRRTPNPPKMRPAAGQEFFRKNSYCARDRRFDRLHPHRRASRTRPGRPALAPYNRPRPRPTRATRVH